MFGACLLAEAADALTHAGYFPEFAHLPKASLQVEVIGTVPYGTGRAGVATCMACAATI